MYESVGVQKLSPNQIRKLLKGERVIVKKGTSHNLHLSQQQHKKLHSAHLKGKGTTIQLDPYQMDSHKHLLGSGHSILGNIGKALSHSWNNQGSPQERAVTRGILKAEQPFISGLNIVAPPIGAIAQTQHDLLQHHYGLGEGIHKKKAGRPRKHHVGGALMPAGYGEGVHKKKAGRPRKSVASRKVGGKIHVSPELKQAGKEILHTLAPIAKEIAVSYIKKKAGVGEGIHKKKAGRPRKHHVGGALMPAGYGEGVHHKKPRSRKVKHFVV